MPSWDSWNIILNESFELVPSFRLKFQRHIISMISSNRRSTRSDFILKFTHVPSFKAEESPLVLSLFDRLRNASYEWSREDAEERQNEKGRVREKGRKRWNLLCRFSRSIAWDMQSSREIRRRLPSFTSSASSLFGRPSLTISILHCNATLAHCSQYHLCFPALDMSLRTRPVTISTRNPSELVCPIYISWIRYIRLSRPLQLPFMWMERSFQRSHWTIEAEGPARKRIDYELLAGNSKDKLRVIMGSFHGRSNLEITIWLLHQLG